jgi:hypothetical protein
MMVAYMNGAIEAGGRRWASNEPPIDNGESHA